MGTTKRMAIRFVRKFDDSKRKSDFFSVHHRPTNHRPAPKKLGQKNLIESKNDVDLILLSDSTPNNNGQSASTIRSRHKVEESSSNPLKDLSISNKNSSSEQINGHEESQHQQQQHSDSMSISTSSHRLPSPGENSLRNFL